MVDRWAWSNSKAYFVSECAKYGVFESREAAISAARAYILEHYYPGQAKFYTGQLRKQNIDTKQFISRLRFELGSSGLLDNKARNRILMLVETDFPANRDKYLRPDVSDLKTHRITVPFPDDIRRLSIEETFATIFACRDAGEWDRANMVEDYLIGIIGKALPEPLYCELKGFPSESSFDNSDIPHYHIFAWSAIKLSRLQREANQPLCRTHVTGFINGSESSGHICKSCFERFIRYRKEFKANT